MGARIGEEQVGDHRLTEQWRPLSSPGSSLSSWIRFPSCPTSGPPLMRIESILAAVTTAKPWAGMWLILNRVAVNTASSVAGTMLRDERRIWSSMPLVFSSL